MNISVTDMTCLVSLFGQTDGRMEDGQTERSVTHIWQMVGILHFAHSLKITLKSPTNNWIINFQVCTFGLTLVFQSVFTYCYSKIIPKMYLHLGKSTSLLNYPTRAHFVYIHLETKYYHIDYILTFV